MKVPNYLRQTQEKCSIKVWLYCKAPLESTAQ